MSKAAIVTGAAGNLGRAVVEELLSNGYHVTGTVEHTPLENSAPNLEQVQVNLSDEDAAAQFVQTVIEKNNGVDVAILTVGGFAMGTVAKTSPADIRKQYQLNFETAYNVVHPLFRDMLERKRGKIFLIGSRPGLESSAGKGMVAYALAKASLFRLADLMNAEAKGTDVVTSVIVPSTIDTAINRKDMPDADFSTWVTPQQIAKVIALYCGDDANVLRSPIIKVYNNA
jgi:NAD(P)-dependent dehydrogenase (short-subunit alcohol dehydrogenase family)